MLFSNVDIAYYHPLIHCLAHVINRQQGNLHRGQGFHLHPGLPYRFHGG